MSIDVNKLENVQEIIKDNEPAIVARCPACAEEGGDNTGNHLIIFADGRFGCVVNQVEDPDSKAHRQRILQLVGTRDKAGFSTNRPRYVPKVKLTTIPKQVKIIPLKQPPKAPPMPPAGGQV